MLHQNMCQDGITSEDLDHILRTLVHDIRSPLGVADGYVRLLAEGKLGAPEDREKAMAAMLRALTRISDLCEHATACVQPVSAVKVPPIPARVLCERLLAGRVRGELTESVDGSVAAVCVGSSLDRVVAAVQSLLGDPVQIAVSTSDVRIASRVCGGADAGSLESLAAERALVCIGARVDRWTDGGTAVVFPLQGDAS